jgi:branched-chain amino acid transport system ATP-binding protein
MTTEEPYRSAPTDGVKKVVLEIKNIDVYYGAVHALKNISLSLNEGEITTLIGANGAGKTSTLRTISGLITPKNGEVRFYDKNITNVKPHLIVAMGMAHAPEGRGVFSDLTVEENLSLGSYIRHDQAEIKKDFAKVMEMFPRLQERLSQRAGTLSGGEQQMLAIGRAYMQKPKVLLLDEPSLGLAPLIVKQIFTIIQEINKGGTSILLVEQNAKQALKVAHQGYVLETGKIVKSAPAAELLHDPDVQRAYLGG